MCLIYLRLEKLEPERRKLDALPCMPTGKNIFWISQSKKNKDVILGAI